MRERTREREGERGKGEKMGVKDMKENRRGKKYEGVKG